MKFNLPLPLVLILILCICLNLISATGFYHSRSVQRDVEEFYRLREEEARRARQNGPYIRQPSRVDPPSRSHSSTRNNAHNVNFPGANNNGNDSSSRSTNSAP